MKRRELRELVQLATTSFQQQVRSVTATESALVETCAALSAARPTVRIAERLGSITLASVDTPGQSIRSESLQRAGLLTLLDAQQHSNVLERIPDIGGVTARRIRALVNQAAQPTREDFAFFSDPSVWNDNDRQFAQTIMRLHRLRSARAATSAVEKSSEILELTKRIDRGATPLGWLSPKKRRDAATAAEALNGLAPKESFSAIARDLNSISTVAETSNSVFVSREDVVEQWRANSAALLALIEQLSPPDTQAAGPTAVPASRLTIGAPQLLPTALLQAIETFPLNTDGFKRDLRRYQHFGARFILASGGAILGDEMGLGKTMQALAVAHHLAQEKPVSRILVIAPVSILENWQRETQGATSLSIHMAYGAGRDQAISEWEHRGGIAFTSYQTLRRLNLSDDLTIDLTVIDEAHKVKNPEALQTQAAASALLQSRHRLLMSGTPLENRAAEFMFLCSLANHDLGDSLSKQFGDGETAHLNAAAFRQAVAPGYLRRNQVDVLTELPEAIIQNESVALTGDEVAAYRQALATKNPADARRSVTIGLGATSSKMIRLQELLEDYAEEGRKVLVFSSFLSVLDVVSEVAGATSLRIDGSVPTSERQRIVDAFSNQSGFGVLVMQIDVGGVGLNIQAASVVIIAEPQWKPSTETQAIGRSFRMGQTRRVNVHRLLAANSIDERIEERQRGKERIFNAIVRSSHLADSVDEATDNTTEAQGLGKILAEESERLGI